MFMFPATVRHFYHRWTIVYISCWENCIFLCYQPFCPFFILLAMVPVFCVISHCVRVSAIVSVFVFFVSTFLFVFVSSVISHRLPSCFHLHIIFKYAVSHISIIVWNMSDTETEVFCMLLTIRSNQIRGSWTLITLELLSQLSPASICLDYTADRQVGEVAGTPRLPGSAETEQVNTLRTGLLNCLNAHSWGLTFRHRASCI